MKKKLAILVVMVLCLSLFAGCADKKEEKGMLNEEKVTLDEVKDTALDKEILAKIGDYEISQAYYNCHYYIVYNTYAQYSQYYGEGWMDMDFGDGQTLGERMKSDTKTQIEQFAAATIVAKERCGITGEDVKDKVEKDFEELVQSYGGKEAFKTDFLDKAQVSEKALQTYFEMYEISALFTEQMSEKDDNFKVSNEEIEQMLQNYPRVRHILISTQSADGTTPVRSDEEALAIVNEVYKKLENGEDFKKLVDEYGEDPGMKSNDYYVCGYGQMVPEFEEASINLNVGEYTTTAVKSDYGYHIIMRYPYEESSEEYKNAKFTLVQEKVFPLIEEKANNLGTTWDDDAIEKHMQTWHENLNASSAK